MKKCFLMPYFGAWPWWTAHFLTSCRMNPGYDWLFFGDVAPPQKLPNNVHFQHMTLEEFNTLASAKLSREVSILNAYKICDCRAALGVIFQDYIADYAFWGHSDIDLVYGDIDGFVDGQTLSNCDIVTPYDVSCGHFQLYRNEERINRLYEQVPDIDNAFKGGEYGYFDHIKLSATLQSVRWCRVRDYHASLAHARCFVGATIMEAGNISRERATGMETYIWKDGHAFQVNGAKVREFLYIHFMQWKKHKQWQNHAPVALVAARNECFSISAGGIGRMGRITAELRVRRPRLFYIPAVAGLRYKATLSNVRACIRFLLRKTMRLRGVCRQKGG